MFGNLRAGAAAAAAGAASTAGAGCAWADVSSTAAAAVAGDAAFAVELEGELAGLVPGTTGDVAVGEELALLGIVG